MSLKAIGSVTLLNVNDGSKGESVSKVSTQYYLSTSPTSLTGGSWVDTQPKVTTGKYLWERNKTTLSDNSVVYSDAYYAQTISGLVSDVDKINGQITNKVWQSDITTSINSYDSSTVSTIRDRVSTTEQNLTGITTRVGAVESTTGSLGTRMTAAESSISQNADNIELKVSKDGVISSINQSSESITISADKVNIAGSTAFTSLNSQVTAIQNETNQKSELIRGTQTAGTYSWTGTSTTISQLTDGMEIRYWLPFGVAGGTVSGSYSYYDGSKTTTGTNSGVGLTLTLKDGTMTEEIPVYYSSMNRLTSHYGYGNVIRMIYRENVKVYNSNTTYYTVAKGFWCDANYNSDNFYTQYSNGVIVGANNVYKYSLIMRDSANTWTSIVTSDGTGTSKSVYTGGLYYDKVLYHSGNSYYTTGKTTGSVYDSISFDLRYSTNCGTTLTTRKPVYLVGTINNTDKRFYLNTTQWYTQTVPTSADGKTYIYIGEAYSSYQVWLATENKAYQYYNGRFITLEEIKDLEAMTWINSTGQNAADIIANWATDATSATTTINGGLIQTHTIQASHLATNAIMSNNYQASQNAGSPYSVTGSFLDLDNGNFYTPNFGLDNVNGNAYFNGEITATSGQIGDDTSNHWQIGTVVDFNGNQSAAIESNGTSYIQSGDWMISNDRIDTRHYDNQRKYTYLYEDGVYWDFGLHTPSLTSNNDYENNFIYIRNHESTIPTLEGAWNYVFRVDRNGMIYINGVSLDDKYASIDGVSGAYLPMTGGSLTGNLSVGGNLTVTGTVSGLKNLSINGKTYNGSSAVTVGTIGAAYGGTGQTSLINSANALINALDTGSSTPVDNDYYISQYVNGGTTTKTYHRRPMSTLWLYIKGKINADTDLYTDKFVPKTGGEFTGAVTVSDALIADEITSGNLIVNGVGRFTNGLYGDLTGNASTATVAAKVADSGNGQATTFAYSKTGLSTTSWFAAWDGYELKKISPANVLSTIGGQPAGNYLLKTGDTMTGVLNIVGQMENAYVGISNSNYSMKLGIGTGGTNRGLWDINLNKWVLYSDASASYFNGNATSATSATTATKFSSSRTIQLTGDVTGSASSNGEGGWSIATTVADNSHNHVPSNINTGNDYTINGLDWIASSKVGSAASNKSFGLPPEAIVIEYSTDGGSTWLDYGSSDAEKANLFNELGCYHHLGKAKTKAANTTNCQLRITITATDRYVYTRAVYFWVSQNGNEMTVDFDVATLGNPTTFSNVFNNRPLQGNSGPNIHYYAPRTFGAYTSSQTGNSYVYRFTFKQPSIASNATTAGSVSDIRLFGDMVWTSPNNMVSRNHMYTWDKDFNVTFPAKITATSFEGNATSASKLNSTRSFTIGKTAKNVDWSGAVSFSQAEISDNASTSAAGWMSKDDKTKLNGIEANAQVNTITGVKGNSESSYRTGNINITAANIGLGNLTNDKQVKGLSSGTTSGHLVTWGSDGYTVADSGITAGNVVKSVASNSDGKLVLTYADNTTSDPIDVEFVATETSSVSKAEALNVNGTAVGSATVPVYFDNKGKPQTANTIPKLNNATTGGTFYAPTGAGTSGQILQSSGGTPSWVNLSTVNTTYTIATGDSNGQIKVTPSSGNAYNVGVKGLGTAAFANTTLFPIVSTYILAAGKAVRIQYPTYVPVLISAQRSNSGGRLILLGGGYGAQGTVRNDFQEVVSSNVNTFTWTLPSSSSISNSIEIMNVNTSGNATITVWSSSTATFTEIDSLSDTAMNKSIITSTNYTDYTVTKTGTGASGTWGIDISGNAATATSTTKANITTVANSVAKYSDTSGTFTDSYITIDSSGNLVVGDNDHPANIKIGAKNDNYGLMPNVNNYNQIGSSSLNWYRSYVTNYYGNYSHVNNWDSDKNIGTAATSSAASTLGNVNFYNTCAAGGTQTKTKLQADSTTASNITVTLPKETGTLALTKNYQPYAHYWNMNSNNSGRYYKISINSYVTWMLSFTVRIYHTYRAYDLQISGYNYGTNHWYTPQAIILGASVNNSINVLFGYDSDYHLWVAIPAEEYTGIDVVNVTNGFRQVDSLEGLFTIEMVDSEPTTVQQTVTAYRPWYRNETVSNANNATNATTAANATNATNLLAYAGNEVTIGANSATRNKCTNDKVYINYRDVSNGSSSNTSTAITDYYFCDRKGSTDGVNVRAGTFVGSLSGTATKATQDGSGNVITDTYVNLTGTQTISGQKTFSSEVRMTAGGTSDICSGVLASFKTNRSQITNLITHNIYTGGTNSTTPITFYKYGSVSSQAPATPTQLAKIDTDGNIHSTKDIVIAEKVNLQWNESLQSLDFIFS